MQRAGRHGAAPVHGDAVAVHVERGEGCAARRALDRRLHIEVVHTVLVHGVPCRHWSRCGSVRALGWGRPAQTLSALSRAVAPRPLIYQRC